MQFKVHYLHSKHCCISVSLMVKSEAYSDKGIGIRETYYWNPKKNLFERAATKCWFPISKKESMLGKFMTNSFPLFEDNK